jgi:hypothetical protein
MLTTWLLLSLALAQDPAPETTDTEPLGTVAEAEGSPPEPALDPPAWDSPELSPPGPSAVGGPIEAARAAASATTRFESVADAAEAIAFFVLLVLNVARGARAVNGVEVIEEDASGKPVKKVVPLGVFLDAHLAPLRQQLQREQEARLALEREVASMTGEMTRTAADIAEGLREGNAIDKQLVRVLERAAGGAA